MWTQESNKILAGFDTQHSLERERAAPGASTPHRHRHPVITLGYFLHAF
jgi:hypothetical protein